MVYTRRSTSVTLLPVEAVIERFPGSELGQVTGKHPRDVLREALRRVVRRDGDFGVMPQLGTLENRADHAPHTVNINI